MMAMKTRFSRKLHMAFGAMLVITLALAWYFYDSVQWFEYDVERIALANSVLNDHRALAAQTEQKYNLIQESVALGTIGDLPQWQENTREIRAIFAQIRQAIADEKALRSAEIDTREIEDLNELESLVETIIGSGETIRLALEASDIGAAFAEAGRLRSAGTVELFIALMDETLAANVKKVADANSEAISLSHYITGVLPLLMLALAGLTGLIAWLFSRSLTRSVKALHDGVRAFTNGQLMHRIPELQEKEFEHLGEAFNTMADELAGYRTSIHDSNVRLEAVVDERTRALKSSNDMLAVVDENRRKLLADISHEFRTPLTVIRGEAEIAMRGKAKTEEEYRETLERIVEQSDRATRLVDDLLFMARADAGEPRLKVRPVSVGSLLGPVCSDFSTKAEKSKVILRQAFSDENSVVMGDAGRLRQVFAILIDNALQYSEPGDTVEVCLKRSSREVIVTVRDSGIGLTEEEARQAFQRFFRGGQAQGHARGTGLGLPVAKAIVEAHKGSITLEGEPGEGAMATVVLPAEDKLKAVA
ncbi:MAG: HAMP domain-containing sensor histidine kinase [Gammaproteobacteria bacterium]|nr:MAG: HAMP domain-containing sensor histidine kinase [Gammaproteobacteria bacterium]